MSDQDEQSAIDAALRNDWETAVLINTQILKENPEDTDSMNRLGKAYLELGNTKKAITIFKSVLKLNKYDPIAEKNLQRASQMTPGASQKPNSGAQKSQNISFLEEPGKTKIIPLVNLASSKTLLNLRCADCVSIVTKKHSILIETQEGTYLGALPDDIGHRLLVLIKGGNQYEAFIKSVSKSSLILFVREFSKSKKLSSTPSFPGGNSDYLSFVREDTSPHDMPDTEETSEETGDEDDEVTFKKSESLHQDEMPEEN